MKTLATVWLDGCSGCHMSFLDMDERLLELLKQVELVYSPLVDRKDFPEQVDITLIEGAVGSEEDLAKIQKIRARSSVLISLGDCAVTSNVPAMRNPFGLAKVFERVYKDTVTVAGAPPDSVVPVLLERVLPVHEVVPVDVYLPGCPPSANLIYATLTDLLAGKPQAKGGRRFGA